MIIPTRWVTVLGPVEGAVDSFGDEIDQYQAIQRNVGIHIDERVARPYHPAEGRLDSIHHYVAQMPSKTMISKGARIKDEDSGEIFTISDFTLEASYAGFAYLNVELEKTG